MTGLLCSWCDDRLPGPLAVRVCSRCAPLGKETHHCNKGLGHLPTFSSHSCASCDDSAARLARVQAEVASQVAFYEGLLAAHVRDWHKPWPGTDFAKVLAGRMFTSAIDELKGRLT